MFLKSSSLLNLEVYWIRGGGRAEEMKHFVNWLNLLESARTMLESWHFSRTKNGKYI